MNSTDSLAQSTVTLGGTKKKREIQNRLCKVAGMRTNHTLKMIPPKPSKTYYKAVTGLFMREEGTLELEDEAAREEVKEIFRDQEHKAFCSTQTSKELDDVFGLPSTA